MEEAELRRRFDVVEQSFAHGPVDWRLLRPRCAESLIDEAAFEHDERLPYWADLWPASSALTRWLLDRRITARRAIELGCGLALPSLALQHLGVDVLATDYEEAGLAFARVNATRNGLAPLKTARLDWRSPEPELGRFDLIIAADVLYERRNADALAQLLPLIMTHDGLALIADPRRRYAEDLLVQLEPIADAAHQTIEETITTTSGRRAAKIDLMQITVADAQ